jgi:hypothetical protein
MAAAEESGLRVRFASACRISWRRVAARANDVAVQVAYESHIPTAERAGPSGLAVIGWAVFVACSWTWVIGMFLPVLLVRDFGPIGWLLFAIPNIVGAVLVGFWTRTPRDSAAYTVRHLRAVAVFTSVTLVLQCFTLAWLATAAGGALLGVLLGTMGVVAAAIGRFVPLATQPVWAGVAFAASITTGLLVLASPGDWRPIPEAVPVEPWALVGLAAVCTLGFLTCPHLDVTLQAARQAAGRRAKLVFVLGFGVLFPILIALTPTYAEFLRGLMRGSQSPFTLVLLSHFAAQVVFTNAAHTSALDRLADALGPEHAVIRPTGGWWVSLACVAGLGFVCGRLSTGGFESFWRYEPGELVYRGLLGFYGLAFPAYVLIRGVGGGMKLVGLAVLLGIAPLVAAYFFGQMAWASLGVAAVVAVTAVAAFTTRRSPATRPA